MTTKTDYKTDLDMNIDIDDADDVTPFNDKPKADPAATSTAPTDNDPKTVITLESGKKVEMIKRTITIEEEYSVQDIHELTHISKRTLSQYFKYGIIKGHKKGKFWFATPDAVKAYMNGEYDRTEYVKAMQPVWNRLNASQMEKRHRLKAEQAAKANDGNQG